MKSHDACYYIQNKAFFFPPPLDGDRAGEPLSTPCWCLRTHEPVGPDGVEVTVEACRPGRACFRPEVQL